MSAGLLAGCGAVGSGSPSPVASPGPVPQSRAAEHPAEAAAPIRVRIPAIKVDSAVVEIVVAEDGALVPPQDGEETGWFADGPVPRATGPALLAGHVDSRTGPAVFHRLRDLPTGSSVFVDRADGSTAEFRTRRTLQTAKAAFPTDAVYAPTPAPELRLVTCGGAFDRAAGHYRDNVVVEAVAVGGGWTVPGP